MSMQEIIKQNILESIRAKEAVINQNLDELEKAAKIMITALKNGKKLLICGNGGSAADAQHFAGELVMTYEKERPGLPAIALTTNSSKITAWANDFGYETVFSRKVQALGNEGDVLVGITTSGNSANVLRAFEEAGSKGIKTICLNGKGGGKANGLNLDANIVIPSARTSRIQESHITVIHAWCELIDRTLFP